MDTTPSMTIIWPEAPRGDAAPMRLACPNCGAAGGKARVLDVAFETPDHPMRRVSLLRCGACDVRFYDDLTVPNYDATEVMGWGWHDFYIQQGAGLWSILNPLARVRKPAGSRYLDVGCAYGFGLDFAIRARGWDGVGVDPSPLAALGARELGVPLRPEYFTAAAADIGRYDVVSAFEVIEHVPAPRDLVALFRAALAPGGVLVLTTPDAAALDPAAPEEALLPMLAPGVHMVFQTEASLARLLAQAGFAHVRVAAGIGGLAAFASDSPLDLETDETALRDIYRAHLLARAAASPAGGNLRLGFAGRALFEAANDADAARADAAWDLLVPEVQTRFGLDLTRPAPLPDAWTRLPLRELRHAMPLNLGAILYGRAMRRLAAGAERRDLLAELRLARDAAMVVSGALSRLILIDGLTDSIARGAGFEYAIGLGEAADPGVRDAVAALPLQDAEGRDRPHAAWRAFIRLYIADARDLARRLAAAFALADPPATLGRRQRWDAIVALAHLALDAGDETAALGHAETLRALGEEPGVAERVALAGFVGLVNAARHDEAALALAQWDIASLAFEAAGPAGVDGRRALASFALNTISEFLEAGRIEAAAARAGSCALARLAADPLADIAGNARMARALVAVARLDDDLAESLAALRPHDAKSHAALVLRGFVNLTAAGRHAQARALAESADFAACIVRAGQAQARDAIRAAVLNDIVCGAPDRAVERLLALRDGGAEGGELAPLAVEAALRLANDGRGGALEQPALRDLIEENFSALAAPARGDWRIARLNHALAAEAPVPEIVERLAAARGEAPDSPRLAEATRVAFANLVNRGAYAEARAIEPDLSGPPGAARHGALFAAGVLALQPEPDAPKAEALLTTLLGELDETTSPDLAGACRHALVIALRLQDRHAEADGIETA